MVGHICGRTHFGDADWRNRLKRHTDRQRLASVREQADGLLQECERLRPVLEPLIAVAEALDGARDALETQAGDLYQICNDASSRGDGLISHVNHAGKTVEVRLRHRKFWQRFPQAPHLRRLLSDLRNFPKMVEVTVEVTLMTELFRKLGHPSQRARDIIGELTDDVQALKMERFAEALPVINSILFSKALRIRQRMLEMRHRDLPPPYDSWNMILNFETYLPLARSLAEAQQAVSMRQEAA